MSAHSATTSEIPTVDEIRTFNKDTSLVTSRRKHIAQCASKLLVKQGYDRTSVREIADACNMTMGTLYRYVGAKEDILYLVIEQGLSEFIEFCDGFLANLNTISATDALRQAIKGYCRTVDTNQDMVLFSYQETKNLEPWARERIFDIDGRVVATFERLLTSGCETGEFKIDNVRLVAELITSLGGMWAVRRWSVKKCCTLEDYIREQTELILGAISSNKTVASEGKRI